MRVILDGLSYFLNTGELNEYTKRMINDINPRYEDSFSIIKDKEIIDQKVFTNRIKVQELYVNRINKEFRAIDNFINSTNADIYHCTNNGYSLQSQYKYNCMVVATIHTIIPEIYESFYNNKYLEKYYNAIQLWGRFVDKIICPSTYIKDEIVEKIGIKNSNIKVILPTTPKNFKNNNTYISKVYLKSKYNFSGEYILYCGDLHRRKRLEEFLEVYSRIAERIENLYFIILCNINSINYDYYTELICIVERMALTEKVLFISSYGKNDKIHFYNVAKAVIDFSIYEGVNTSLLEAKHCGANIICSDIKTFRELLGAYPLYLDLQLPFIDELIEDFIMENNNYLDEIDFREEKHDELYSLYEELIR